MNESPQPEGSLADEFRALGENLIGVLRVAWQSSERKRLQQEVGEGLADLATTLKQEIQVFQESPTGQRIRSDVEDLRQRIRSGEAEEQLRDELLHSLRMINTGLEKAASRFAQSETGAESPHDPGRAGRET